MVSWIMGKISDKGADAFKNARSSAESPSWLPFVVPVGLVVFLLLFLFNVLFGGDSEQVAGGRVRVTTSVSLPPGVTILPTGPTDAVVSVSSLAGDGTNVWLPRGAVETLRAGAVGALTGDFTGVTFAEGVSVPVVSEKWPNAAITSEAGMDVSGRVVMNIAVDPDGPGPDPVRVLTVETDRDPSDPTKWVFYFRGA